MRNQLQTFLAILFLPIACLAQEPQTTTYNGQTYFKLSDRYYILDDSSQELIPVSSEIISLKIIGEATTTQLAELESLYNLSFIQKAETGWSDYRLNSTTDLFEQCTAIQDNNFVDVVEVSSIIRFDVVPNDSAGYSAPISTWHYWGIPYTKLDKAWDKTTGSPSIVAAILDSGVDWWHEDFAQGTGTTGNIWVNSGEDAWANPNIPGGDGVDNDSNGFVDDWRGWNFGGNSKDVSDFDYSTGGHGTSVAGVLGARTHNFIGVPGVAGGWNTNAGVSVMIVKVADANDAIGLAAYLDDAILYAAKNGAHILNMSLSIHSNFTSTDNAIERAYNRYNCVLLAASGNDSTIGKPVLYPASHPK